MTDCAQERALVAKRTKILQETIACIAEWDGAREQLATAALPFDQGEASIIWAAQEVRRLLEPPPQTGTADIPRTQLVHLFDAQAADSKQARSVFRRRGFEPSVEYEKVPGIEPKQLLPLARRRIAIGRCFEVWVDVRMALGEPRRQQRRKR
jgi:hypothetical protein